MKLIVFFITCLFFLFSPLSHSHAQVEIGISIGDEGLRRFYLSVGSYYRMHQKEVVVIRDRGIPAEEIPVVLFIANRVSIKPSAVIDLRLHGKTWLDIMLGFGLSPEVLYVPVKEVHGTPYGKAYGYYKKKPKKQWKKIVLSDADVINLVNLRFISDYHRIPPEEVIKLRSEGKTFTVINDEVKKTRKEKSKQPKKNKGRKGDKGEKQHGKKKE